jgi:hypothetical protein
MIDNGFHPHTPFEAQRRFLAHDGLEATLIGGAGGGKSEAMLMAATQYAHVPGYRAMIFRNTYADLVQPGSLLDRCNRYWGDSPDITWSPRNLTYTFPSGAVIGFGYMEKPLDHLRYKGMELQFIGFDDFGEISKKQYRYMFCRLRKPYKNREELGSVPLRMRSTDYDLNPNLGDDCRVFRCRLRENTFVDPESMLAAIRKLNPEDRARFLDPEDLNDND